MSPCGLVEVSLCESIIVDAAIIGQGGLRGPPVGNPFLSSFQMCFDDRGVVLSTPVFAVYQCCLTYFFGCKKKVSVFGG